MSREIVLGKQVELLRSALAGLVGASEPGDLRVLEAFLRASPAPAADKADSINAIHALLALEENVGDAGEPLAISADEEPHPRTEAEAVFGVLRGAVARMQAGKPNDRSEADRRWAVSITQMETALAYFKTWVVDAGKGE